MSQKSVDGGETAAVPNAAQFGDYRFQDPAWLSWWLTSLYMLSPGEQVQVAQRLLQVVHARESREVLEGFIDYQMPDLDNGREVLRETEEGPTQRQADTIEADDTPLWLRVLRRTWKNQRTAVILAGMVVGFYAWKGLRALATHLF